MQIRSSHFWVETCKVELEWLETGCHTWLSLFRAVRLSSANEFYLKRDGTSWMRGSLQAGGFQVIRVRDPREEQDAVNLRMLQASEAHVLQQATATADTAVGNVITNHANILNRDIRPKGLNLEPQGIATKNFSMGGEYHIAGLPHPTLEHDAVNLRTLNRKVLNEIRANNLLEAQKYLRLDGQNQMVSDLQMNDHKIVRLADVTKPSDGVNKRTLDAAVNSLRSENGQLILATNENINRKVMFLDGTSLPENHQNYNDKRITNLGEPVEDTDAATKGFIDNQLRKRTFQETPEGAQGHHKMNNHKISGLANPTQNNDAVHKHYTDSRDECLITSLTSDVDDLRTRVIRLERLSPMESTEPAEAAETVSRE